FAFQTVELQIHRFQSRARIDQVLNNLPDEREHFTTSDKIEWDRLASRFARRIWCCPPDGTRHCAPSPIMTPLASHPIIGRRSRESCYREMPFSTRSRTPPTRQRRQTK